MIKLFRVDDRLIHGQVQTKWISTVGAEKIIVVDTKTSQDPIALQILKIAVPNNIELLVYNETDAVEILIKEGISKSKSMVLFKSITTIERLVNQGVDIREVNVGPVSSKPGTRKIVKNTYFTSEEINAATKLSENNVYIYFQLVPDDSKIDWLNISRKIK